MRGTRAGRTMADMPPMPGPWGFLTSGYFLGIFIMGFLLNRVQNVVVPPRGSLAYHHHRMRRFGHIQLQRQSVASWIFSSMFPVDLSSTFSRLLLRIPSLYLLGKALLLLTIVLLQTSHMYPSSTGWSLVQSLGDWAKQKSMDDICWFIFTSVCIALFVGALTNGMEGIHTNSNGNAPFNLFAYAFVLYLYTSPLMLIEKSQDDGPLRPDKHAIITIALPLLQLFMTHAMEVRQKWARLRLVPTTIVGLLTLIHFHIVLWFYPTSYPLPNYIPNIAESFLLAVTVITCALNALTQLFLTGSISKPLIGHTASLMPKWDEDFNIVLLRLGTASLEATSVAGWGNEVGGVGAASVLSALARTRPEDGGVVELGRAGVISLKPSVTGEQVKRGFANEITRVKAGSTNSDYWLDSVVNATWRREALRFGKAVWSVLKGLWRLVTFRRSPALPESTDVQPGTPEEDVDDSEQDVYERFLRGDMVSDDEDDAFEPPSRQDSVPQTPLDLSDTEDTGEDTANLYADLSTTSSASAPAPLLLAHMVDTSSSPLTRRRYSSLVSQSQSRPSAVTTDDWDAFLLQRRVQKLSRGSSEAEDDSRRNCVVCTVEPRDIICWPCRCLALCDDCRENLASRSAASKHICPCCRQSVEGYSKIYIP
ncbi:hypothetical protein K474DRAFT_1597913 [Panus rudis PR-1116 ss-1]|nr:hypothetical protein K474DRAFT_1597913 [Panus rudis PR-1116 ss-1]